MTHPATPPLSFLWHFHQPDYRDAAGGFRQPWVYLHAIKDYADMAWHLEQHAGVRVGVNFSSVLLVQLQDYGQQAALGPWRDPLLQALARPAGQLLTGAQREHLADQCLRIKRETMVHPYPAYRKLEALFEPLALVGPAALAGLPEQTFDDLLFWYHLAWLGESVRRHDARVQAWLAQARDFSPEQRQDLLCLLADLITGILPRYRALAERGQVELSCTPYSHPLAPLMLDFAAAHAQSPEVPLPQTVAYPGGEERVRWQIRQALATHEACFGMRPIGMWPAEAAVSEAFVRIAGEEGIRWVASNQSVLAASRLPPDWGAERAVLHAWQLAEGSPVLFFRHEAISERFGFEYSQRKPAEAVADFQRLVGKATAEGGHVCVILDGENAWEHYPANAYDFFDALYSAVAKTSSLQTAPLAERNLPAQTLGGLTAGSWAQGGFSLWIGDSMRNRAWDLLCEVKQAFDTAVTAGVLAGPALLRAEMLLARAESSDWFWWLGFDAPASAVASFDQDYRDSLADLWVLLGQAVPATLAQPLSRAGQQQRVQFDLHARAQVLSQTQKATLSAQLPEGRPEWVLGQTAGELDAILNGLRLNAWCFVLPALADLHQAAGDIFKYSEIKIALEKAHLRFFEGEAKLVSGALYPGLLVVGLDSSAAAHLARRFGLPAVMAGQTGRASELVWDE
ncbi:glycoside hydrolase family 57 protein [Parachitinimonas caeni]|uniref:Glycoside hydrolase family 57 protein n=1 Tax=Parachitinimonas caeni TaxID=3031301 RepID=A0ABT7DWB7_9NEIS|nr:glycoside hydrolase family 57 protein [Parachitinimonas caeni]MDK2124355.1 glycoside hydrolase family 57 protein [Parachitinimonas caeni]